MPKVTLSADLLSTPTGPKLQYPKRPTKKIGQKQLELRDKLWPNLNQKRLWSRKERNGFITVPRAMPLILSLIDAMSKGKPLSSTYFELWCRVHDESFITLNKPQEHAYHAGFTGQRALITWRDRVRALANLGFVDIKPGSSGELSYALILNPYIIIKEHCAKPHSGITEEAYNALLQRSVEIGADDLD